MSIEVTRTEIFSSNSGQKLNRTRRSQKTWRMAREDRIKVNPCFFLLCPHSLCANSIERVSLIDSLDRKHVFPFLRGTETLMKTAKGPQAKSRQTPHRLLRNDSRSTKRWWHLPSSFFVLIFMSLSLSLSRLVTWELKETHPCVSDKIKVRETRNRS